MIFPIPQVIPYISDPGGRPGGGTQVGLVLARPWDQGGGHFGDTKWLPTAKRPCGAEAVNAKI